MTNLQGTGASPRFPITPEQALVILPALGGGLLAVGLAAAGLLPLIHEMGRQDERLRTYEQQQQQLPALRRRQVTLDQAISLATAQETRLLKLVSDVDGLETLLTVLNQMAAVSNVAIMSVEPERDLSAEPAKPGRARPKPKDQDKRAALPEDERFEKKSYLMTMEGGFSGLLEFLRKVETLNTAVLISDLEIQSASAGAPTGGSAGSVQAKPSMKFRLTAYQRKSQDDEASTPSEPQ